MEVPSVMVSRTPPISRGGVGCSLSPKKISAVQFSPKGDWVFIANKFGEVLTASCSPAELEKQVTELKPGAPA
eukprot:1192813-Prorocentrum_minimum.AAC.2